MSRCKHAKDIGVEQQCECSLGVYYRPHVAICARCPKLEGGVEQTKDAAYRVQFSVTAPASKDYDCGCKGKQP